MPTPFARALLRLHPVEDVWDRIKHPVPIEVYGEGSEMEFTWYLEGESRFSINTIDELVDWLMDCRYISDPELFHRRDFWQHPCTFEQIRSGDCEDFSLWAWRKLIEMGRETEFVAGRVRCAGDSTEWSKGHAWVHVKHEGRMWVLDAVLKERHVVLRPLDLVRSEYLPEVSVDQMLHRYVYGGYYLLRQNDA